MTNITRFNSVFLVIITIFLSSNLNAQNIVKQLRVMNGGNVPFVFNTMNEYNNGKALGGISEGVVTNGWTRLYISFTDTTMTGSDTTAGDTNGWELLVEASTPFLSDVGNNELSLDSLKIFTKAGTISNSTVTSYNHTLSLGEKVIATGTHPGKKSAKGEIELSYYLYMKLGKRPDFYNTYLIFTLREK